MHGLGSESIRPLVRRMMDSSGWLTTFKALHLSDEDISSSYDGSKLLIFVIWDAGLGRRLMRMASAFQLAKVVGRKLLVYWILTTTALYASMNCLSNFEKIQILEVDQNEDIGERC